MWNAIANAAVAALCFFFLSLSFLVTALRLRFRRLRARQNKSAKKKIAFFHPYCSSGGGGERVLWKAIQALDELHEEGLSFELVIYTIDASSEKFSERTYTNLTLSTPCAPCAPVACGVIIPMLRSL